jgi:hypothetical protein
MALSKRSTSVGCLVAIMVVMATVMLSCAADNPGYFRLLKKFYFSFSNTVLSVHAGVIGLYAYE